MNIISIKKNSYRKITLRPFLENDKNTVIFSDHIISLIKCLLFSLISKKKNIRFFFCDNETTNLNSKILFFFLKIKKINLIWFNGALEIKQVENSKKFNHYIFFKEQKEFFKSQNIKLINFFPKKIINNRKVNWNHYTCYISEVLINIDSSTYPNINNLDKKIKNKINNYIWETFNEHNLSTITNFNFSLKIFSKFLNDNYDENIFLPEIYGLIKNRLRYLGIKKISKIFKDDLTLIGETWKKLGFNTVRNNYDYDNNIKIYKETKIPIDFGASTGEYPIYLRTYEILKNSSWILQSNTRFSKKIYSIFSKNVTFDSFDEMISRLKYEKNKDLEMTNKKKNFYKFFNNKNKIKFI